MFSVDYATLRQIIEQFVYTGVFRAPVENPRLVPEEGVIELQAQAGIITACQFVTNRGQVYLWDHWETQLARFGVLNWELTADAHAKPQRARSLANQQVGQSPSDLLSARQYSLTPYHAVNVSPSQLRRLPMLYRQVYALIDGRRQISAIAFVLNKSQQEIILIVDELRRGGYIAFK